MDDYDLHYWEQCSLCKIPTVICYKCKNNTCNGTYGLLSSGLECDACSSAYEVFYNEEPSVLKIRVWRAK